MVDYARLRTELLTDPQALGYSGLDDAAAAARLHALDTGRTRARGVIPAWEVKEALVQSEYAAATAGNRQWVDMIVASEAVPIGPGNIRTGFLAIFGAASQTRANLAALQTEPVSRAEELGLGPVTPGDVTLARTKSGGW